MLPCPAATAIETLKLANVARSSIREIWYDSESFNAYRGEDWMQEPCRTCDRRSVDFGGCRCQAFLLTGDAAATDPVCSRSPQREVVDLVLAAPRTQTDLVMRWPKAAAR